MLGEETYLGQLRAMRGWCAFLFFSQLWTPGLFYSHAQTQKEEHQTKHTTFFAATEHSNEKQLINDLHQVLERLQNNKFPVLRKKHGYLPACDPGEQCALRIGSRIGKLCDCSLPRTCNSFLHRCL
uniref:Cocaine- and amphetamine-regulated transcript protein n=1 Tax=Nothobranchius furzeri TaxID=105023 RepID=A0A8C6PDX2_NOTFU